jgi:hypothetical protein
MNDKAESGSGGTGGGKSGGGGKSTRGRTAHTDHVGKTFVKEGQPDRVTYDVDDVVQARFDGYRPEGEKQP